MLAVNGHGEVFVAAGRGGVFRSIDNGDYWLQINNGITSVLISHLAINSNDDIFAGGLGGMYRSTDNGDNWSRIQSGMTSTNISALAIHKDGEIFAGTTTGGLFRSSDNGNNWNPIKNGLTSNNILALTANSDNIFAGTLDGVFLSKDKGDTWSQINHGLTNHTVSAFAVANNGYIFAGTNGGGVYRRLETTTVVEENIMGVPASFSLEQNYPNPFNPSTVISFQLAVNSAVSLSIYNMNGQLVRKLVTGEMNAGRHNISWDATNERGQRVASGVYLYIIRAGEFTAQRKLMLMK